MKPTICVTDSSYDTKPNPNILERAALRLILDPRDLPLVRLAFWATIAVPPFAFLLYWPGCFRWWKAALYLVLLGALFLDRFTLLLHNSSHRTLFRPAYRWLNAYIPWVLGPFFGQSPSTYFCHHLGMHHPENNLEPDLSSTMRFRRDHVGDFGRYLIRFLVLGLFELAIYLRKKNRLLLLQRMLLGETVYFATVVALAALNWRATLTVFVLPLVFMRFAMMAGNWGQHAFIDPTSPENFYRNSITCINTRYNRRCFNDGYHTGHHVRAHRHFSEMPSDFLRNSTIYEREGAIVFEGIDFFQVWLYLMLRRYDRLARHYVSLGPQRQDPTAIEHLLRQRTQPVRRS